MTLYKKLQCYRLLVRITKKCNTFALQKQTLSLTYNIKKLHITR